MESPRYGTLRPYHFHPLASDQVRLEIQFEDDMLDVLNEARDRHLVASFESVALFAPTTRVGERSEAVRCETLRSSWRKYER